MDGFGLVRISAFSDHAQGPATPIAVPLPDVPSGTASLESFMDYSSPESMHSRAQEAAALPGPTSSNERRSTASEPGKPEPSCVETIRRDLRQRKFKTQLWRESLIQEGPPPGRCTTPDVMSCSVGAVLRDGTLKTVSRTLPVG